MPLDVSKIIPQKGRMTCTLWENDSTNLPLQLFYSIEIPLAPFDTGHEYVEQPAQTALSIEWIRFFNENGEQEKNWRKLANRHFVLSYDDGTAEGSIYLGTEHCTFNVQLKFGILLDKTFELELQLQQIDFNIDTVNLRQDGIVPIKTQVEFEGFILYSLDSLPSFEDWQDPLPLLSKHIDLNVYQLDLLPFHADFGEWQQLKPK